MRVINCKLRNFASYKELEFNFDSQGLTLIQGPTGSGKSTLCDAIPWVLFGRTAKDGAVDEVRSWNAEGPTTGTIIVDINGRTISITRSRVPNDLYFRAEGIEVQRGKDLNDTQKLINGLLHFDVNIYLSGAYFHEFSQTAQFFITTAKNRRAICEQLVDLSLAKNLQLKLSEQRKELAKFEEVYANNVRMYEFRIQQLEEKNYYIIKAASFAADKERSLANLTEEILTLQEKIKPDRYFNEKRKKLQLEASAIGEDICSECGNKKHSSAIHNLDTQQRAIRQEELANNQLKLSFERLTATYSKEKATENTYGQLEEKRQNELINDRLILEGWAGEKALANRNLLDMDTLLDVVNDFRGITIRNTIKDLEHQTNKLLTDHYDAEIRVLFEVADADKLDVTITKDGNTCAYSQLSKGQRQLLKLCFGVSVMRSVANRHGIKYNSIFLDESMDGLDDNFKIKTFRLLEGLALEYESVFVVEHNEALKSLFTSSYRVSLVNGSSQIEKV